MNNELNNAYEAYVKRLKLEQFLESHGYKDHLTNNQNSDTIQEHNNNKPNTPFGKSVKNQ